ncbi:FkbM family methyltransferase [Citrobacter sp. Cb022]|uniref:FkbM family methyltransferase n=1 Tax=Citrobacter sp. Cb022 TaxID=2985019 RepID=UPI00257BD216|nr:FkbM family methyltransferase [Citrobacter sp. Cb022]MDM3407546.1 FkbM family methyltransferase [Citrobacter sp. Cb022]
MVGTPVKVVFYFPWNEVSGGPIYLTRLADKLAELDDYEVYYTDYENSLSDSLIKNSKVKKIVVSIDDFSIKQPFPVILITPIYFAGWIPDLHPDSKIVFINWHMCCVPTLQHNWRISDKDLHNFLRLVRDTSAVFFCDESHRLGQNTDNIIFSKDIVPISLPKRSTRALTSIVSHDNYNVAVLGRLCADKIYSITNLLDNIEKLAIKGKVNVHIIGDGPDKEIINECDYKKSNIIFVGTLSSDELEIYLANYVDILFAMGTSVLEGGSISLPSVIIPHNMHPINCNSYVYLQNSNGYCLGWYDDQFDELKLIPVSLQSIFDDVYKSNKKALLGQMAYNYYEKNHSIENTIEPFKNILKKSSLFYRDFCNSTKNFVPVLASINLLGFPIFDVYKEKNGYLHARLLQKVNLFHFRPMPDSPWKRLYFIGLPWFEIAHIGRKKFKFRLLSQTRNQITMLGQHLTTLNMHNKEELKNEIKIVREQSIHATLFDGVRNLQKQIQDISEKLDKLSFENKNTMQTHITGLHNLISSQCLEINTNNQLLLNEQIQQMDTCEKLLSEESLNYFCGDIKNDYIDLITGLDDESVRIVNRVISRIQKYRELGTSYFHFTMEEQIALRKIEDQHASSILRLNSEYFAYARYIIPIKLITTTVFYYKYFISELLDGARFKNKAIIDVGGSFGDSALIFAHETKSNVHVFEPTTKMFNLAKQTISENNINNVVLNKLALGDKHEYLKISVNDDFSSLTRENSNVCETENVEVTTLDSYVEANGIDVGLIKVDIEGFEKNFLIGAEETIRKHTPVLIISIYHSAEDFFKIKTIIDKYNLGYKFKIRKPSDKSIIVDTMLIAEVC